ncbi:MAG: sulfotransferase [Candidatus Thorarchaeota archaeon]
MSKCIVILAMHRSGSSLLASILRDIGVDMGKRFREPDEHNPQGYWEDLDWRDMNKIILREAYGTWYDPSSALDVEGAARLLRGDIKALVDSKSQSALWGFKDPRTCITISAIHPYLPNPHYIFLRRERDNIIASLMRRAESRGYSEPPEHWLRLCEEYESRAVTFLLKCRVRTYTVSYEQLVDDKDHNVKGIKDFVLKD